MSIGLECFYQLALTAVDPVGLRSRVDGIDIAHIGHLFEQRPVPTADGNNITGQAAAQVELPEQGSDHDHVAEGAEATDQWMRFRHSWEMNYLMG